MENPPDPSPARDPFNDTLADVILRSSDHVDFYVYKVVLSLASPFFKDMFSLTQPVTPSISQNNSTQSTTTHPIVNLTEDGKTIDRLLRLVYPVVEPPSGTLDEVARVLEASIKYQVEKVVVHMKASLLAFSHDKTLAVYAVACRLQSEHEAHAAAIVWKGKCASLFTNQMCPCGCGCQVQACHCGRQSYSRTSNTCGCHETYGYPIPSTIAVKEFSSTTGGASFTKEIEGTTAAAYFKLLRFVNAGATSSFCGSGGTGYSGHEDTEIPDLFRRPDADLVLQSIDGVNFRVHTLLLALASAQQLLGRSTEDPDSPLEDGLPLVQLDEPSTTLGQLLRMCYPFPEEIEDHIDLPQITRVRVAAEKYEIPQAIALARGIMSQKVEDNPIQAYFLCKQNGWEEDAQEAMHECLRLDSVSDGKSYVPEMESSPAKVYYDLLKVHFDSKNADSASHPSTAAKNAGSASHPSTAAGGGKKKKKKW